MEFSIISENYDPKDKKLYYKKMTEIIESYDSTYSPLALFFLIDNQMINSKEEANILFDQILKNTSLEKEIKNLMIYKKTLINADYQSEDKIVDSLKPLINSKSIWKPHSLLLLGDYFLAKGEKQKAKDFYYQILKLNKKKSASIGTLGIRTNSKKIPVPNTTLNPIVLCQQLEKLKKNNINNVILEASSHGLKQNRLDGLNFKIGIFTNLSHDHLDYHKSFLNYLKVKKKLFDGLNKKAFAVINSDDNNSNYLVQNCNAKIFRYGLKSISDFKGKIIQNDILGLSLELDSKLIDFNIIGEFNAYNILAVYSVLKILNFENKSIDNFNPDIFRLNAKPVRSK